MFVHQVGCRPIRWENAVVGDIHFVGINADLNRVAVGVILVYQCVIYSFAHGFACKREGLDSGLLVVPDFGLQVFCENQGSSLIKD